MKCASIHEQPLLTSTPNPSQSAHKKLTLCQSSAMVGAYAQQMNGALVDGSYPGGLPSLSAFWISDFNNIELKILRKSLKVKYMLELARHSSTKISILTPNTVKTVVKKI